MISVDSYIHCVPCSFSIFRHGVLICPPPFRSSSRCLLFLAALRVLMSRFSLWIARRVFTQNGQA